jgi:23S rRNA (guanine745-N1)-methyltransferase
MSLQTLSEWLRCPICFLDLNPREPLALSCSNGHSFDVNKRGYVSLIAGSRKLQADSPAMLDARDAFLAGGWYAGLRTALADAVNARQPHRILDVGCGTGYYLDGVLQGSDATTALAMDLSPAAVPRAVRAARDAHRSVAVDGLVADVWSPLPIRDAVTDVILSVFAPRNAAEFHRVLRADGLLAVVVPDDTHLRELRAAGLMLDVQPDKAALLIDGLAPFFSLESRQAISTDMTLSSSDVAALVGMGPSAHHSDSRGESGSRIAGDQVVHAAFELMLFRSRAV